MYLKFLNLKSDNPVNILKPLLFTNKSRISFSKSDSKRQKGGKPDRFGYFVVRYRVVTAPKTKIHAVQATKISHLLSGNWPTQLPAGITSDINAASFEISGWINLCSLNKVLTRDSSHGVRRCIS